VNGVAKDAEQAVSWYRQAADAGNTQAQCNLARATLMVMGLPRMQSWQCRGTAAQQRRATHLLSSNLGVCYKNGDGVVHDAAAEQACTPRYRRR